MDLLWSVRIAEKVRMGLLHPCVVLISASAMFMMNQRVVLLGETKCGITRVPLTCFARRWDRMILARNNTWMNIVSDPTSYYRIIPVLVKCWGSLPLLAGACLCVWDS